MQGLVISLLIKFLYSRTTFKALFLVLITPLVPDIRPDHCPGHPVTTGKPEHF